MEKKHNKLSQYYKPGQPYPLFDHIEGFDTDPISCLETMSTVTKTTKSIQAAFSYLVRAKKHKEIAQVVSDLESADEFLDRALGKIDSSDRFQLLTWRMYPDSVCASKFAMTFGLELERRINHLFPHTLIIKKYTNKSKPDTEKIMRLGHLYEQIHHAHKINSQVPLAEISAHTLKYIISMRTGDNLAYTDNHLTKDTLQTILDESLYLGRMADRMSHVVDLANKENYFKKEIRNKIRLNKHIPAKHLIGKARMFIDSMELTRQIVNDEFVPQSDPQPANITVENGRYRHIDLEGVVSARITSRHLAAHLFMEPLTDLSFDERMALIGEEGISAAYHYLESRIATILTYGYCVPYELWKPITKKRLMGFFELFHLMNKELAGKYKTAEVYRDHITPDLAQQVVLMSSEESKRSLLKP